MTIKTTDLLELLTKAGELDLSIFVKKDEDGDYVVKFYKLYSDDFDEKIIIDKNNISCGFGRDDHSFDDMMSWFDALLKKKEEERIKEQKRQEVLARLSNEEKELLGLSSSQSVPHKSQMPF
jgi:hypothetical protein